MRKVLRACTGLAAFGVAMDTAIATWLGSNGTASTIASVALGLPIGIAGVLYLIVRGGGIRRAPASLLVLTAYVAWCALSVLWSALPDPQVPVLTRVQLLLLVWLSYQLIRTRSDLRTTLFGYVMGAWALVALTWRNYLEGTFATWNRYAANGTDPNDMAIYLSLGIPMAAYLAFSGPTARLRDKLPLLYVPAALTAVALSGSRTGTLATTAVTIAVILGPMRKTRFASALLLATAAVGTSAVLYSIPTMPIDRLLSVREEMGGSMGDRTEIWRAGLLVFPNHPVIGVGAGGFGHAVLRYTNEVTVAHSTPLSLAVEVGIVGLTLFFGAFGLALHGMRGREYEAKALVWSLLLASLIGIQTLSWEHRKPLWFVLMLSMVASDLRRERAGDG
jgi:O-antigen ligase